MWVALAGVALCIPLTAVAQQSMPPEQRLLQLLNQARIANGLNPLAPTPELTASASAHARDMVQNGYMEHTARDGSSPQQRAARAGYDAPSGTAWLVLEVISARQTPEAAANWLLSDPLHRGVVLRDYFREAGPPTCKVVRTARCGSWSSGVVRTCFPLSPTRTRTAA